MATPLERIRAALAERGLDAWIIFSQDPHLCEYPPAHWFSRGWASGFHGSAGTLVVTAERAALFTDSRYWVMAERVLEGTGIELVGIGAADAPTTAEWLAMVLPEDAKVGFDVQYLSFNHAVRLIDEIEEEGLVFQSERDIIDELWTEDRPARPATTIFDLATSSPGRPAKLLSTAHAIEALELDAFVFTALDDIAWFTNCRASDIEFCPLFIADLIVERDCATLFVDAARLEEGLLEKLGRDGIRVEPPSEFLPTLDRMTAVGLRMGYDPDRTNARVVTHLNARAKPSLSPITYAKAHKSEGEVENIRKAMFEDGCALVEFYAALDAMLEEGGHPTELELARLLHEERARRRGFLDLSFGSIVAFGAHAAEPHYAPSEATDTTLTRGLLLIDSGAQFETGTTDITRMTAVGELTDKERRDTTVVLKGHIALARARVRIGSPGADLDAICRAPLHAAGLDFGHGTGHGVGFVSNVHEGPFHISPRSTSDGLLGIQPGQLVSNEPGYYEAGSHGVRIENLILAHAEGPMIRFETMTLCPIDPRTIDPSLLDEGEKAWLNGYNDSVRKALSGSVGTRARRWLEKVCAPVA